MTSKYFLKISIYDLQYPEADVYQKEMHAILFPPLFTPESLRKCLKYEAS